MTIKLIDSHCHLPENIERQNWLARARTNDVVKVINIGTNLKDSTRGIEISKEAPMVYTTIGVYPHEDLDKGLDIIEKQLENLLSIEPTNRSNTTTSNNDFKNKIVAIGECGIDITNWTEGRPVPQQVTLFEMQIQLAIKHNLPIVIHNRDGDEHVFPLLQKYSKQNLKGVAHCFDGTWETAQKLLALDFYISFSGFITYNSKKYLQETVKNIPLDKFVLETDSPYILPKGAAKESNNKQNEPKNVKLVAQKVSEIKNLPFEKISETAYNNTCQIFGL